MQVPILGLGRFAASPAIHLLIALGLFLSVAGFHWLFPGVPLGVFYVLPVFPAALALSRWQILLFGLVLASVRSAFLTTDSSIDAVLRFLMGLLAYWATGLFLVELVQNRLLRVKHKEEITRKENLLVEAERHLRLLAESSPAAILTLDKEAKVLSGNLAAISLLGITAQELEGFPAKDCLPVLADALRFEAGTTTFRTSAQCHGKRANGDHFVAQTWFSTYDTPSGRHLAAIAVDISDEIRDREEQNLRQLLANNRIIAAAVSHEIRNTCGAITLLYSKIQKSLPEEAIADNQAMGSLVSALGKIAALDLQVRSRSTLETIDLNECLEQVRVIIEPDWKEANGKLVWNVPKTLPRVVGESYGIVQVMMNLSQNSLRAVASMASRSLELTVSTNADYLLIRARDTGPGVATPSELFEPFRSDSGHGGIGLYVSRAILRSYGGDLKHEASTAGAVFVVEVALAREKRAMD